MLCVQLACFHRDASRNIVNAARDCSDLSDDASSLCTQAKSRGQAMIQLTKDVRDDLKAGFSGKLDANVFVKIKELIEQKKTAQALSCLDDMNGMVGKLLTSAQGMGAAVSRGLESLPDDVRDEYEKSNKTKSVDASSAPTATGDMYRAMGSSPEDDVDTTGHSRDDGAFGVDCQGGDDANNARLMQSLQQALARIDDDVLELDRSCATATSRGTMSGSDSGFNLFTAGTTGAALLETTTSKGNVCQTLLSQMHQVCSSIAKVAGNVVANGNCCALAASIASAVRSLISCRGLVQLLTQAAHALQKLVHALKKLIEKVWHKVQSFMEDFGAAKKLGRFVNNLPSLGNGKVVGNAVDAVKKPGRFAKNLMNKIF